MFTNKSLKPLPALPKDTDSVMGENLALHRPVSASNTRGNTTEFIPERALDGNPETYWATHDNITTATFELDLENPVDVNRVKLAEVMELGPRIQAYKVEGQVNSDWKLLSQGTTIGTPKVDKFPKETVWKVKITITKASGYIALKKVGLYLAKNK